MIQMVISGGQTGVDQAALRAARRCGIATGGIAPLGWRTETGPAPWLEQWGLVESAMSDYEVRTELNIIVSEATLVIAKNITSPGTRSTMRLVTKHRRPSVVVRIDHASGAGAAGEVARQLASFRVVNVAGHRESVAPGIGAVAEMFLVQLFVRLRS